MRPRLRRLFQPHVLLIALFAMTAGVALLFRVTSTPNSCATCHEMRPIVASFKTSTHAAMGCMGCHTDPGQINFVKAKIRDGAKDVYGHFFGYQQPIRSHVPNERCLSCHPTIAQRNTFLQLDVAHDKHLAKNIACTQCHGRVGHQTMTLSGANRIQNVAVRFDQTHREITLKTCFASGCHEEKSAEAKTTCVTCHIDQQRVKPKSHAPGFLARHGADARADARGCLTCHKSDPTLASWAGNDARSAAFTQLLGAKFCRQCHARDPHPSNFEHKHNEEAQRPEANCSACHRNARQFCDTCHQMRMPHPAGFVQQHGRLAKRSGKQCAYCHDDQADCASCHRSTRPATHGKDFREKHGVIAKARPENCMLCHARPMCDSCHRLPMPHPPKYAANHTVDASKMESACANCHRKQDCLKCHEKDEIHLPNVRREVPPEERDPVKRLIQWASQRESVCPARESHTLSSSE